MTMGRTDMWSTTALALYFVCIGLLYPILAEDIVEIKEITAIKVQNGIGKVSCKVSPEEADIQWLFQGEPFEPDERKNITTSFGEDQSNDSEYNKNKFKISTIIIHNATFVDAGNYTCITSLEGAKNRSKVEYLDLKFNASLVNITESPIRVNATDYAKLTLECIFEVYNITEVKWYKRGVGDTIEEISNDIPVQINITHVRSVYPISRCNVEANGTYVCEMKDPATSLTLNGSVDIFVYSSPKFMSADAIAINTTEIYLNWTVLSYNAVLKSYYIFYSKFNDTESTQYNDGKIGANSTSFVMKGLEKATKYNIYIEVKTTHGTEKSKTMTQKTLAKEPVFVPTISINGFSATSVTIGWAPPGKDIEQFIHYYLLEARKKDDNVSRQAYHSRDTRNLPYMFDNLEPHSTYVFQVCACSDYGEKRCGNWSEEMEAATLDGIPSKPSNVTVECTTSFMNINWRPPLKPNAEIKGYTMELTGNATYIDRFGKSRFTTWGPLSKFTTNFSTSERFVDLQPNTHYTVKLSAMTRTRRRGEEETRYCNTTHAAPDQPPRPRWRKILENDKYMFKMYLPRISERNGPICCYRVYMVRLLPNSDWKNLPPPKDIQVVEYEEAHAQIPVLRAYITDIFSNEKFPEESELVMGDSKSYFDCNEPKFTTDACLSCLKNPKGNVPVPFVPTTTTTTASTTTVDDFQYEDGATEYSLSEVDPPAAPASPTKERRSIERDYSCANKMEEEEMVKVLDGPLDSNTNYTLFVELISGVEESVFSNFVNVLMPAPTPLAPQPTSPVEIALQATCAIAALVLLLMIVFCIRQTRRSRKMPPHAHIELNPLQMAYRYITGLGGRTQMVPSCPPDMAPIAKEDLAAAYAERQADSDYLFQKEFEMLPECYNDRTTHASEARENQPKNRYPDIKAYDQTRVKLTQIDSITGSDYINANYVLGYQERKRFICAQGPTDTTVNDFWRMIWEHGLELIVMLTNLEEYSKVKCSKYWPDEVRGARVFGNVTVQHVSEKRYSDYIVRELKITKQPTTAEGQPIVENNGVAKRNGDCKEPADGSVPTSPREVKDTESRIVKQYHFLMWKDFAAPEHAYSILKFIKRVNEAWSAMVGAECVVHCSAGVGRTGTLVALDCLLEQLRAEGRAAVFNTVAELRRQRNFLVQSLKQYVFVYRALVEYAHYGDTEIPACRLKSSIDRLRNTPPGAANCLMELEFEKILNCPIPEPLKSCAAGAADELRAKNRSQDILPYDRNRVILAPIATREYSTYINASFIEAYDNSEGFIITQDPLPNTIMDFWRMVSEHNVTTIVMLSELGEGKCPRYWDDGTAQYEHISVQYEESESCPYYTRRQFRITNNKVASGCSACVRQLQYQGWPTAPGAVPEVTRGLAELADAASASPTSAPTGTMLVHCQYGTERSALFVALCVLICQLRAERRVDVCCVARKVRSQRPNTIDTFLHYEFLHRAILNYAELHNLLEDS